MKKSTDNSEQNEDNGNADAPITTEEQQAEQQAEQQEPKTAAPEPDPYQALTPSIALKNAIKITQQAVVDAQSTINSLQVERHPENREMWSTLTKTVATFDREAARLRALEDNKG